MLSVMSWDEWQHSSSPLKRNPVSLSFCCSILASLSAAANVVDASSFLLALIFTSLQTRVWDSKINLFKDAVLPGFNGMGCRSGCNCASVGVCPGWQAANASLARDVIPFVSEALASAFDSATSSALLFRAFTDSKEVPIAKIDSKGAADEACKQNVNEKDQHLQLRSKQGKSLDFYSADFNSLLLQGTCQGAYIFYRLRCGTPLALAEI